MYQQINQRRDRTQRREQPCKQQLWQRGWKDKEKTKRSKEKVDGPTRNRKAKKQQSSNRMSRVGRLLPVVITSIADFDDDDDWRRKMMHRSALVAPRRSLVGAGTLVEDSGPHTEQRKVYRRICESTCTFHKVQRRACRLQSLQKRLQGKVSKVPKHSAALLLSMELMRCFWKTIDA